MCIYMYIHTLTCLAGASDYYLEALGSEYSRTHTLYIHILAEFLINLIFFIAVYVYSKKITLFPQERTVAQHK